MNDLNLNSLVEEIKSLLSDPVQNDRQLDGTVVLVGGDPGEVIVRISGSKVSIAVYSVRWEGSHTPVVRPMQIATLNWKRLPAATMLVALHGLINAGVELRRAKYRRCDKCGETKPPEWMHGDDICQSCAEHHLGVVY